MYEFKELTFDLQWKKHFTWKAVDANGEFMDVRKYTGRMRRALNEDISDWLSEHDIIHRIKWLPLIEYNSKSDAQIIFETDADLILFIMRWG